MAKLGSRIELGHIRTPFFEGTGEQKMKNKSNYSGSRRRQSALISMNTYKLESRSRCAMRLKLFSSSRARRASGIASFIAAVVLGGAVHGATIADFGATAPTPGANDVAQLTAGTADDTGANYFTDKD